MVAMSAQRDLLATDRLMNAMDLHGRRLRYFWDDPGLEVYIEAHRDALAEWRRIYADDVGRREVTLRCDPGDTPGEYQWRGYAVRSHDNHLADTVQMVCVWRGATIVLPLVREEDWSMCGEGFKVSKKLEAATCD